MHQVHPPSSNVSSTLHNIAAGANLEVRIGYFGSCFKQPDVSWLCSSDSGTLLNQLFQGSDPLNLAWIAKELQDGVLFSGLT
jgi:hypothetical protein